MALFIILTLAFSSLTGCGNTANMAKGPQAESPAPSNVNISGSNGPSANNNVSAEPSDSAFPPPPSVLTEAEIKNIDGTTFKLEDRKGQVVLLNLWATWCGPCRGEMPHLVEMQNKYSDKNFKVIGLNTDDEGIDEIKEFAAEMKLNYELAWIDQKTTMALFRYTRFSAIPQTFLIDRDGRLRNVFTGGGPRIIGLMKEAVEKTVNGTEASTAPGKPEPAAEPVNAAKPVNTGK